MTLAEAGTETPTRSHLAGYAMIIAAVCFWGASAALAKYLFTREYSTLVITQMRSSLSFLILAGWFAVRRPEVFRIERRDLLSFVGVGVIGIAMSNYTYYLTVSLATVATAILLQYTAPVMVMVYMIFIAKEEHGSTVKTVSMVLALVGCYLAVLGGTGTVQLPGWSVVTGPAAALCYAYILIVSKRLLRRYSAWTLLVYAFGVATIFWLVVQPPWEIIKAGYGASDWGIFWIFAVCSILIPHTLFTMSLQMLEASTVGIVSTLEPVVAIGAAWLVVGESLAPVQIAGAAAIVLAVLLLQVTPKTFGRVVPGEHI